MFVMTVLGTFRHFLVTGSESEVKNNSEGFPRCITHFVDTLHSLERIKSEKDLSAVKKCLTDLYKYLPGPITVQKLCKMDQKILATEIIELYSQLLSTVIKILIPQWPVLKDEVTNLFVLEESFDLSSEILTVLCGFLRNETEKNILEALAVILLKYTKSDAVLVAILDCSSDNIESKTKLYKHETDWENYVQILATLPERVANKLKTNTSKEFSHENFSYILIFQVLRTMDFMADSNFHQGIHYDISYLSNLLSKVITNYNMNGNSEAISKFVDVLIGWSGSENDECGRYVRRKLIQTVLFHLNRQAIDFISVMLLKKSQINYRNKEQSILNVLGDNLDKNKDWKEILTVKIPLYYKPRDYKETDVVENLIFYISTSKNSSQILSELILRLINAWSDVKLANTSNITQHMYLSQLLILAVKYRVVIKDKPWNCVELKTVLFKGMSKHLDVLSQEFRCIGMATTEIILKILTEIEQRDKDPVENLTFDYESMGKVCLNIQKILKELTTKCLNDNDIKPPNNFKSKTVDLKYALDSIADRVIDRKDRPVQNTIISCAVKTQEQTKAIVKSIISAKLDALSKDTKTLSEDLDSDDDLQPYDMSNDITINAKKRPNYLRDLIESLNESKDFESFEASLDVAEELVNRQLKNEDPKLALELLDLFIHLEPKFRIDGFDNIKFNTSVAIVCSQPNIAAEHLCKDIHTDIGRYSIATKIFMLDVLSESANRIADVRPQDEQKSKEIISKVDENFEIPAEEIIRRRLINKTKYFHTIRPHPFSKAKKNEFAAVSDYFFYPLVSGFGSRQLSLSHHNVKQDFDSILLYKYLAVVGNIILSSKNCPKCPQYCSEIIPMLMYMRYTPDPKIQSCVISLIAAIVLALPRSILIGDFFHPMMEFRTWLADLLSNVDLTFKLGGPKSETAIFAGQILHLIEKNLTVTIN